MAFLTLFRVATGDNWNGIMKDTLRDNCDDAADCVRNCCVSSVIAPIFFVIFVLMAQFVLVNVVVAVLMKHLEESHKQMEDEADMETELEREFQQEQEFEEEQALCLQLQKEENLAQKRPLAKILSLPSNFTYSTPVFENKFNTQRRQTLHYLNQSMIKPGERSSMYDEKNSISETGENNLQNEMELSRGSTDSKLVKNLRRPGRKKFCKEMSLDEGTGRRNSRSHMKRMSCDNLSWNYDKNPNVLPRLKYRGEFEIPPTLTPESGETKSLNVIEEKQPVNDLECHDPIIVPKVTEASSANGNGSNGGGSGVASGIGGSSGSSGAVGSGGGSGNGGGCSSGLSANKSSFLSVPKLQARNRSGSTKQLFKQKALDEDQEIDENSLLLPTIFKQQPASPDYWEEKELITLKPLEKFDNIRKSDSCEILRIISERRMLEKRDNSESNEHVDYNQLLINKPPQSST